MQGNTKRILQLNSYYIGSHLYPYLFEGLDGECAQTVYVPLRRGLSLNNAVSLENGRFVVSNPIVPWHRVFFFERTKAIYRDLLSLLSPKDFDMVHAHNLFIDGMVALRLHRDYGLPYMVAVRMTDVDLQYRYMWHRRGAAHEVLKEARKVIFISDVSRSKLLKMLPVSLARTVEAKSWVIPNGIQPAFAAHTQPITPFTAGDTFRIAYVGRIVPYKHLLPLMQAVENLNRDGVKVTLDVVGGKDLVETAYYDRFTEALKKSPSVHYLGEYKRPQEFFVLYAQEHLMALPSRDELFGLVYLEAISQNTPVLYCAGAGIEAYVKNEKFAISLHSMSIKDIEAGIMEAIMRYQTFNMPFNSFVAQFDWKRICSLYETLYNEIMDGKQR